MNEKLQSSHSRLPLRSLFVLTLIAVLGSVSLANANGTWVAALAFTVTVGFVASATIAIVGDGLRRAVAVGVLIPLAARGSSTFSTLVATAFSPVSSAIDDVIRSGRGDVAFDRDAYFQLFSLWTSVALAALGAFIAMWAYNRRQHNN